MDHRQCYSSDGRSREVTRIYSLNTIPLNFVVGKSKKLEIFIILVKEKNSWRLKVLKKYPSGVVYSPIVNTVDLLL